MWWVIGQFKRRHWVDAGQSDDKKMAQLNKPHCVFVSGGEIYFSDTINHRVRKVLRNGQIVTICGNGIQGYNGDGQLATNAQLNYPCSVVVSSSDQVYISERNRIRKIDRNGVISTIAGNGEEELVNGDGQLAVNAKLNHPYGIFVTEDEQVLFTDRYNNRVRKIDRNGTISTIAEVTNNETLDNPTSVFQYKNVVYIADSGNHRILKMGQHGNISEIANVRNTIGLPFPIFVYNDELYFTDGIYELLKTPITRCENTQTLAGIRKKSGFNGHDMLATQCQLYVPRGIFVDDDSQIYIADTYNHCIRRIDQNGMITTIVGTGQEGYSGDVPFDFKQYPHIGPKKKQLIKPFPHALYDLIVICSDVEFHSFNTYEPVTKKIKYQ